MREKKHVRMQVQASAFGKSIEWYVRYIRHRTSTFSKVHLVNRLIVIGVHDMFDIARTNEEVEGAKVCRGTWEDLQSLWESMLESTFENPG